MMRLVLLASSLCACTAKVEQSSTPPGAASSDVATPPPGQDHDVLTGRYESADGPFSQITFYDDSHVVMTRRPCNGDDVSCFAHGTYTIDAAAQTLSIKDDVTGEVTTGPLHVTQTDPAPADMTSGTTSQALTPDDLISGIGSLITGVKNMVVRAFSWLGDFVGLTGFSSSQFGCSAYGMVGSDGRYVSTVGMPNNPSVQLTTSRGGDGTKLLHIDSLTSDSRTTVGKLAPQPLVNGYTQLPGGSWTSMDSSMLSGGAGNVYMQLPSGPLMFHCTPN